MSATNVGAKIVSWAAAEPSVQTLILIGSQVHAAAKNARAADEHSDWDFQVVTSRPELFSDRAWVRSAGLDAPLAYAVRGGRLGSAVKVSAILPQGEFDLVIIPAAKLRFARALVGLGLAAKLPALRRGLGDLAVVLRAGFKIEKGEAVWGAFLRRVATEIPPPRLDDDEVRALAEGFVCDYLSTCHKLARGEWLAAQRWLHHQLAETNFRLLHELRQRRGEPSLPDARRLEMLGGDWQPVAVGALPASESLRQATEKAAATFRALMEQLVGATWRWPALESVGGRGPFREGREISK